jgi:hypothetical protein
MRPEPSLIVELHVLFVELHEAKALRVVDRCHKTPSQFVQVPDVHRRPHEEKGGQKNGRRGAERSNSASACMRKAAGDVGWEAGAALHMCMCLCQRTRYLYSGSSRWLKHVCAVGRRSESGPFRLMMNVMLHWQHISNTLATH